MRFQPISGEREADVFHLLLKAPHFGHEVCVPETESNILHAPTSSIDMFLLVEKLCGGSLINYSANYKCLMNLLMLFCAENGFSCFFHFGEKSSISIKSSHLFWTKYIKEFHWEIITVVDCAQFLFFYFVGLELPQLEMMTRETTESHGGSSFRQTALLLMSFFFCPNCKSLWVLKDSMSP